MCFVWTTVLLLLSGPVHGDIYRFVDEDGVIHYTNTPSSPEYVLYMRENDRSVIRFSDTDTYDEMIQTAADRFDVSFALIKAVIRVESAFDPEAVSPKGARGLMQIMPANFRTLSLSDPFDPSQNIMAGTRYLKKMLTKYEQQVPLALAAYNAGPDAVDRYRQIPPFKETREYVRKVMAFYNRYKGT
jgi:soluble lytic murein transglycosylase-like protein